MLLAASFIMKRRFLRLKQILEQMKATGALMGEQKCSEKEKYRRSYLVKEVPVDDALLLYHTLSGEMLLMSQEEISIAENNEPGEIRQKLIQKWFLVPLAFDEKKYVDQIRTVFGLMEKKPAYINYFDIFTTMDCNARCFYCFEKGRPRTPMSDETARDVAKYIQKVSKEKQVKINWFGGEPLYNLRVIDIITTELKKTGTVFSSNMISNGYLFDENIVKKAKEEWKLQRVQITLDGTENVYNKTKAFIYADASPYQKVIRNIRLLLDAGLRVRIRLNMHRGNVQDLNALADELYARFPGEKNLAVYVALLRDDFGNVFTLEEKDALEAYRVLNRKLLDLGLRRPSMLERNLRMNYCMADSDSSVTVLTDGRLGICENITEDEIAGSIYSDEKNEQVIASWRSKIDPIDECNTCAYYPLCNFLKKCPYIHNSCTELDRQTRLDDLKERIYTTYRQAINDSENEHFVIDDVEKC